MRLKSLDTLRGAAAASVVFYNLWNRFYPGVTSQAHAASMPNGIVGLAAFFLFGFGYLGVDLFFVLSGFCIHLPQAIKFRATGSDKLILSAFGKRRFWRLYPAYFASLVWTSLVLVLFPLLLLCVRGTRFNFLAVADISGFLTSAFFLQQFNPKSLGFNGVYWTLVYEVQFYLFYPLLLWLCRKFNFASALLVLLGLELALAVFPIPIPLFFLGRFYEWFLGMYLAERFASGRSIKVPIIVFPILLGLSIASVFFSSSWPFRDVLASTAFAALLCICLDRESSWRWLSHTRLVAIGVSSYSLYLFHVPLIDLVWNSVRIAQRFVPSVPQWTSLLSIPASFILARFFFRFFEKPFLPERKAESMPVQKLAAGGE